MATPKIKQTKVVVSPGWAGLTEMQERFASLVADELNFSAAWLELYYASHMPQSPPSRMSPGQPILSRMQSARLGVPDERLGFGGVVLAMKRLIAACRSTTEWNTPCLSLRRVNFAKNPSTAFSQDDDVGMKWKVQRR